MINLSWTDTVSYHLNPGTNHMDLLSFIYLRWSNHKWQRGNFLCHIVNLYNNTVICINSDAMGHNCPTISHLAYSQSLECLTPELYLGGSKPFAGKINLRLRFFKMLSSDAIYSIITSPRCMIRMNQMKYLKYTSDH